MNLWQDIQDIKVCHAGKYRRLNVIQHDRYVMWTPQFDDFWCKYKKSRNRINRYKLMEKILTWLKII